MVFEREFREFETPQDHNSGYWRVRSPLGYVQTFAVDYALLYRSCWKMPLLVAWVLDECFFGSPTLKKDRICLD